VARIIWINNEIRFVGIMGETEEEVITPYGIDNIILMQYTGMKDKNGREIYEGDIVRDFGFLGNEEERIGIVVWDDECVPVGFNIKPIKGKWADEMGYWWKWEELEIIGNVYENPELLKEEEK